MGGWQVSPIITANWLGMLVPSHPGPGNPEPLLGTGFWGTKNKILADPFSYPSKRKRNTAERLATQLLRALSCKCARQDQACLSEIIGQPQPPTLLCFISWKPGFKPVTSVYQSSPTCFGMSVLKITGREGGNCSAPCFQGKGPE